MSQNNKVKIGEKAPDFKLISTNGEELSLSDFKDKKNIVLYFYPKNNTPGCNNEACEFRDINEEFEKLDTVVIGISKDKIGSHKKFKEKFNLPFDLVSDEARDVHATYDVLKPKKMFGKDVIGTIRSTFVIDKQGNIVKEFRNVKATGHANDVLEYVKQNMK
ncbi:peroxiredoxin [Gottschalkia purinilytica]|uniref:thioredoxin-dependent peroxiredoxin n=1 Tax=Gottschalkia purinilytica TaxID=1503 RepID=A0A0L0WB13_GOTPU|nr:peroxiredoxin [Gottschalkia purinilytica]KNF08691.1 peroxiredoxin [Gottschalkia purinilytica]